MDRAMEVLWVINWRSDVHLYYAAHRIHRSAVRDCLMIETHFFLLKPQKKKLQLLIFFVPLSIDSHYYRVLWRHYFFKQGYRKRRWIYGLNCAEYINKYERQMAVIIEGLLIISLFEGNSTGKYKVCKYQTKAQGNESFDNLYERKPTVLISANHRCRISVKSSSLYLFCRLTWNISVLSLWHSISFTISGTGNLLDFKWPKFCFFHFLPSFLQILQFHLFVRPIIIPFFTFPPRFTLEKASTIDILH